MKCLSADMASSYQGSSHPPLKHSKLKRGLR